MKIIRNNKVLVINLIIMLILFYVFSKTAVYDRDINYKDLIGESIIVLFQIVIIILSQRLLVNKKIYIPVSIGFSFILNAYFLDSLDEIYDNETIIGYMDTYFIIVGLLFLCFGFYFWLKINNEKFHLLKQRESMYKLESITDEKTGLYNSRHFKRILSVEIEFCRAMLYQLSLLIIDIDNFKKYNDKFGHVAGDEALKVLGDIFHENIRDTDFAFRYGGEEFAILLPGTDKKKAKDIADRIRISFASTELKASPGMKLSVSIGIADYSIGLNPDDYIKRADSAMYQAKKNGKNRTVLY